MLGIAKLFYSYGFIIVCVSSKSSIVWGWGLKPTEPPPGYTTLCAHAPFKFSLIMRNLAGLVILDEGINAAKESSSGYVDWEMR